MRLVIIFLLYWCFHLLGGSAAAQVRTHNDHPGPSLARPIEKAGQLQLPAQEHFLAKDGGLTEEDNLLVSVDEEEEEDGLLRKPVWLTNCFLAFSYAFILHHRFGGRAGIFSASAYACFIGAPKYIVQRVLRI